MDELTILTRQEPGIAELGGALKNVKKATQEHMAKLMQAGGMGGLFGK